VRHDAADIVHLLERQDAPDRAVLYRLLVRDKALEVFELLDAAMRAELFRALRGEDVANVFEVLDPDDRVLLLDDLPAGVAQKLLSGLSPAERELTAPLLDYARGSVGRVMSTEYVRLQPQFTLGDALSHVRHRGRAAYTVYTLPVTDPEHRVLGVVWLRDVVMRPADTVVADVMTDARHVHAHAPAERSAHSLIDARLLAVPVVDGEERLVGILTVDDASRILEEAENQDAARQGASEPLRRPYLTTPVLGIVKSRVVWLLHKAASSTMIANCFGVAS
jgi:magnesium transporter